MFVLGLLLSALMPAFGMEPLALLATQPVWQAAQPISINVDYDGCFQAFVRLLCLMIHCVVARSPGVWYHG